MDETQGFDRVWLDGLLYKLKKFLCAPYYYLIVMSYLENGIFSVRVNNSYSENFHIQAAVCQGSEISHFIYSVFAHDTTKSIHTSLGTYAEDTIILAANDNSKY